MKLENALKQIKEPLEWTIRFNDYANGEMFPTTVNVNELYKDWYSECEFCPENGEFVYGITVGNDSTGQMYLIQVDNPCSFTFEQLMRAIETIVY